MMNRRKVLATFAASPLAAALPAWAAEYPERPVKLIVPFSAGGSTDMIARLLADKMGGFLGKAVVVDNRGGAGGSLGADAIAKAAPDGYTIGMATVSTHGANPAIYAKLPYDPIKDFTPITNVMSVPSVFVVHPSVPAKTMKEFIALAKANPGKYSFASPGNGSLGHANIEHFMDLAGIQLLHVPYKGSGQALNDALGGMVNSMTDNLPSMLPHIKAGKVRALAVLSPQRSPILPDVPTYSELGFKEMSEGGWFGLVGPAGLPAPVLRKLTDAAHKTMATPEFKERAASISGIILANSSQEFGAQIKAAIERYRRIAKAANIRIE
ncbi:tripartite tricarboxylate transporter substrate binding protein BugE [Ramlibacter sp.]|uniref:tripartite tricarboxylate transporter substrate binding protein BugE n=1 Tax=Ramlibacter sp. TaxID=1917967 RepID=UPI002B6808D2|nr:tripartite tricarboxylate transporter substrate binding protein BugE [Ramlibacter sp.]HWI83871.1 tripartite tricarboxylate transporter substrate binding protein BugE [Ramlibacter sp.]